MPRQQRNTRADGIYILHLRIIIKRVALDKNDIFSSQLNDSQHQKSSRLSRVPSPSRSSLVLGNYKFKGENTFRHDIFFFFECGASSALLIYNYLFMAQR